MKALSRFRPAATTSYDLGLVAIVLALLAIGLAMVFSASGIRALDTLDDPRYFVLQQTVWAVIGLLGMFVVARIDYHRYRALSLALLALTAVLLVIVLVPGVGTRVGGAARWLRFSSFAGVQPAELAKLALILYFSFWFAARRDRVGSPGIAVAFLSVVALFAGLVIAEPDLGTTIVIGAIAFGMYFAAGARLALFGALVACATVVVAALALIQPYRLQRVMTFLDPWADPRGAGFQVIQAIYALALGGLFGEGLGAGTEKFGYLPAAYTDSIFAVLGNEMGLLGTLTVVLLFLALAFKGVRIALAAPDAAGALIATGITVWLVFQAWLNMAVVASLVPMTGITLPFISYGGSSLCLGLVAVGILLNVGRQGSEGGDRAPSRVSSGPGRRGDGRSRQPAARDRRSPAGQGAGSRAPVSRGTPRARG